MLRGFLVCVICNSISIHSFIFKLVMMIFLTLKMCTFHFVHISYFLSYFWWMLNLDIFSSEMFRECLVCVICNSNSIHYFIFKLCLMVVQKLKMCTSYFVQISFFFSLFRQMLNLDIFKQFPFLYIKTLCFDCHTLNMYTLYLCIFDIIFLRV